MPFGASDVIEGLASVLALGAGLALIVAGAEAFFRGLLASAAKLRVSAFFLTVLVSGLEVENIAAGIAANLAGFPGAAAGSFFGGTTFIVLAVAGIGAGITPVATRLPDTFLVAIAVSGVPVALLGWDRELSRIDGVVLIGCFCGAMAILFRTTGTLLFDDHDDDRPRRFPLVWLAGGLAAMTVGGEVLSQGLQSVVSRLGLSPTLLGNTALAALTEAEEVARVAVPTRWGRPDVAVANIGGTAIHFLTLNAGILAVIRPLPLDEATMRLHLPAAVSAPVLLAAILRWRGGVGRVTGLLLAALYVAYIAASIALAFGFGLETGSGWR